MPDTRKSLVFATAPYLNAAPLTCTLGERDDVTLIHDAPSCLPDYLADGRADVALVPVVDYLCTPELDMIAGLGVGADGPVSSVLLYSALPPERIRTIAGDPGSHTSNLLVQVILREQTGATVELRLDALAGTTDASVVIGDRALMASGPAPTRLDLAAAWKALTGLPFVFAVWAFRRNHPRAATIARIAAEALAAGRAQIPALAARHADRLALPFETCRDYLLHSIRYDIGDREMEAIGDFGDRLTRYGLATPVTKSAPGTLQI